MLALSRGHSPRYDSSLCVVNTEQYKMDQEVVTTIQSSFLSQDEMDI